MKTIKESILNSTNAGKSAYELTEKYLLQLGWTKKTFNKYTFFYHPDNLAVSLRKFDDDDAFYSYEYDKDFEYKCKLTTKKDFEFISKFWKEIADFPIESMRAKLISELVKYFGKNCTKKKI